ncbi:UDP-glucuronate decarboxylase [Rhodoblastus acidophilus]|uniref:UDP-glucuronate decarboxylase n=1 Tax=Rhodoblastus acidophilus TaxID=1074 RepID=A0A212RQ91_RHOAC|nr:UDP-glucuronic acid decarboxylase family protein [Rhodoblastus acidophilus]MCW2316181.1 UDP-glucuronate decarboxylase [Rhodoblastus acidophilus]PPQ38528.1 NAD-dependent epimerase/dehydratase family protein [Rhodoblastus acidophilus]RAI21841.1 NAD-dependent epimerase/dehydratase family protein [Rhodoblastus acidophilus]SNB74717.1 UDP-glucuronate decarboxylase [Rhodoblastus acidophilus]
MGQQRETVALVAGGAGFIGSHLSDALLARGWRVLCLDNFLTGRYDNLRHLEREPRFDILDADVTDPLPARLTRSGRRLAYIFNLACAASPPHYQADPEHTLLTNVLGTRHLLALAQAHEARFLLASTSEVYGDPETHPQRESYWGHVNPTGPRACYDEGKRAAETLAFDFLRARRGDVRVARIFNTYGPRMRADDGRVVSNAITQALSGDDITIYGAGEQTRSFCYVDDMVDGLMRLMLHDSDYRGAINLGNPDELMVKDLAARVLRLTGARSGVTYRPLPIDDPRRRRPDISIAERVLDWRPRVALDAGLKRTIAHFSGVAREAAMIPLKKRARARAEKPPA